MREPQPQLCQVSKGLQVKQATKSWTCLEKVIFFFDGATRGLNYGDLWLDEALRNNITGLKNFSVTVLYLFSVCCCCLNTKMYYLKKMLLSVSHKKVGDNFADSGFWTVLLKPRYVVTWFVAPQV